MATSELVLSRPMGYRTQHSRADRLVEAGDMGTRQLITQMSEIHLNMREQASALYTRHKTPLLSSRLGRQSHGLIVSHIASYTAPYPRLLCLVLDQNVAWGLLRD